MLFKRISMQEASELMAAGGNIVVDVRRRDEYAEAHIPGAICIPLDEIDDYNPPEELPDLAMPVLVYCAGGVRSAAASYKLAQMGYETVYDCGGIDKWTGETVKGVDLPRPALAEKAEPTPSAAPTAPATPAEAEISSAESAVNSAGGAFVYNRRANYHETDKMGIIHHSNYIKWMEEARMAYLAHMGIDYAAMERAGAYSPVVSLTVDYKRPVEFGDEMELQISTLKHSGVVTEFGYEFYNRTKEEVSALASSKHCFVMDGRPIALRNRFPNEDAALRNSAENN